MIKVEVKGLRELQAKLTKEQSAVKHKAADVMFRAAQVFVRGAQRDAPKDYGAAGLSGGISFFPTNPSLQMTVVSAYQYSPYIEWGTITRVKVPAGEQSYAIQFKGRGIKKNGGLHPRPFFFKQTPIAKAAAEKGLRAMLDDIKL
jgi:hypothetical protein